MSFFTPQHDQMDCGPACICTVAKYHGKKYSLEYLRKNAFISREGVSLLGINEASKKIGFETLSAKLTIEQLTENKTNLPFILHWNQNHFVVCYKISKALFTKQPIFHIADPAYGKIKLNQEKFEKSWLSDGKDGVALFLNPTEAFYKKQPPKEEKLTVKYLINVSLRLRTSCR
jgi:ATP-binding cassette subfamily B protein